MTASRKSIGKAGEDEAVKFLEKNGFKIIERNYKRRCGEIDIIAKEKDVVSFIEVKARRTRNYGLPQDAIHARKQGQISKTAQNYIIEKGLKDMRMRFDVVAVSFDDGRVEAELIRNAFESIV